MTNIFNIKPKAYAPVSSIITLNQLTNLESYLIQPYSEANVILLHIARDENGFYTRLYDSECNQFSQQEQINKSRELQKEIYILANFMMLIGIGESIFYFNDDGAIIEWMSDQSKFVSFGMIYESLSRTIKTLEPIKKLVLSNEVINDIESGVYGKELIVRPNIFKTINIDNKNIILRTRWKHEHEKESPKIN